MDYTSYVKFIISDAKTGPFSSLPQDCMKLICSFMVDGSSTIPIRQYMSELYPNHPKSELNKEFAQELWRRKNYYTYILSSNLALFTSPVNRNCTWGEWNPCGVTMYPTAVYSSTFPFSFSLASHPWKVGRWPPMERYCNYGEWTYNYYSLITHDLQYVYTPGWFGFITVMNNKDTDPHELMARIMEYSAHCLDMKPYVIHKMRKIEKGNQKILKRFKELNTINNIS